jgi:hypothetical protein
MTSLRVPRDRPSLRQALSAAAVAGAVGALLALGTGSAVASPARAEADAMDPFMAAATTGPAWIVSPRAARPGEVVHVRLKFKPTVGTSGLPTVPQVLFAFLNDLRHPVQGQLYAAEGTFGVDLLVPPGTDWGSDPIVWAVADAKTSIATPSRFLLVSSRNAPIPFVASRSAQPPLWNR